MIKMEPFDFDQPAEIFASVHGAQRVKYYRFSTAAQAIRYVVEEMPPQLQRGLVMEADEVRYRADEIFGLYKRSDFPLEKRNL